MECEDERIVHGITCDSRVCQENDLFVCIQGSMHHGCEFIQDARRKKAIVLCEGDPGDYSITQPKKTLAALIRYFYDEPSDDFVVIGVTGTNGKSSVTSYLKQMLTKLGYDCLRIGTDMIELKDEQFHSTHTTPSIMENLSWFLKARENKIHVIIMELSSHAIEEERIGFVCLDRLIYTNLSLDHLDYHKTFTHYQYTKFKARNYMKEHGKIILNYDDIHLHELLQLVHIDVLAYGRSGGYRITNEERQDDSMVFHLDQHSIHTKLKGSFNVENLSAACVLLHSLKIEWDAIIQAANQVNPMPGRMEWLEVKGIPCVIDYAHTPQAIESLLSSIKEQYQKNLIVVMGCGGERDRKKRPLMLDAAAKYARIVIVTQDNPRNESQTVIFQDMQIERYNHVISIEKREKAIQIALKIAVKDDIIVVAGKGNEQMIQIHDVCVAYNDKAFLLQLMRE